MMDAYQDEVQDIIDVLANKIQQVNDAFDARVIQDAILDLQGN